MNTLKLGFSGTEALDIIQNYYPKNWQSKLNEHILAVKLISESQNITMELAFTNIFSKVKDMAFIIELIACQHFLQIDEKVKIIEDLKTKQLQIGNQLIALESNDSISFQDKKILRQYYLNLQNEYQIDIDRINLILNYAK